MDAILAIELHDSFAYRFVCMRAFREEEPLHAVFSPAFYNVPFFRRVPGKQQLLHLRLNNKI